MPRAWRRALMAALSAVLWRTGLTPGFCGSLPFGRFSRAATQITRAGRFQDLPLSPEAQVAVKDLGYSLLTEVQQQTFTPISKGEDLVVRAKTGSGKTLSFLLPTMDRLHESKKSGIQILVLSPVRELSMQIHHEASKLAERFPAVQTILMVGGSNWEEDLEKLNRSATHGVILIATPGRLQTHLAKSPSFAERLADVQTLILDEVDQLCGELFAEVTGSILEALTASQYLFYSATVTEEVKKLIEQVSKSHDLVDVLKGEESTVPEGIVQTYKVVPTDEMSSALWQAVHAAREDLSPPKIVVIFITGRIAAYYAEAFRQSCDLEVFEIHSRMKQQQRTTQSESFRAASSGMLFTSDVTSRGLDYPGVTAVIQVGAPDSRYEYVHRVGRTGRAEAQGLGILLLHDFEADWLANLQGLGLTEAEPWEQSAANPSFQELEIAENVKAQAYYSRINHAMRHPENLDVLEVFKDAYRFAKSVGALDADSKPPPLTEANAQRYGVADLSPWQFGVFFFFKDIADPAVHILKEVRSKTTILYQTMSAAEVHHAIGFLLTHTLKDHAKVVVHFVSGDLAKYYAELLGPDLEVFEAHSAVSKKVRKKILQNFDSSASGTLFTAGLSPATLPCKGVTAVVVGLPSPNDAKQLLEFMIRCGKGKDGAVTYLLAASFEAQMLSSLLEGTELVEHELKANALQEAPSLHEKLISKAYFTWLRHYGLHPLADKSLLVQEAPSFASALGAKEVPPLTQQMVADMGLAGVDDDALNVKA